MIPGRRRVDVEPYVFLVLRKCRPCGHLPAQVLAVPRPIFGHNHGQVLALPYHPRTHLVHPVTVFYDMEHAGFDAMGDINGVVDASALQLVKAKA